MQFLFNTIRGKESEALPWDGATPFEELKEDLCDRVNQNGCLLFCFKLGNVRIRFAFFKKSIIRTLIKLRKRRSGKKTKEVHVNTRARRMMEGRRPCGNKEKRIHGI